MQVFLTVDVEPDCPPYLWTWRGIEQGMPRLMEMLDRHQVPVTFFITGDTAERYPELTASIAARGHELGNHGYSHHSFADFDESRARSEIIETSNVLRQFAPVTSFRAPYLRLPEAFVRILPEAGITTDASRARYKFKEPATPDVPGVARLAASIPTSAMRLPAAIRNPVFRRLPSPVVLFVHPWEFVDISREKVPFDCRFRTGVAAVSALSDVIELYRNAGAEFRYVRDWREPSPLRQRA